MEWKQSLQNVTVLELCTTVALCPTATLTLYSVSSWRAMLLLALVLVLVIVFPKHGLVLMM
jgi:hypothetical protein